MKTHENAQIASTRQMLELASSLTKNLPKDLTAKSADKWIQDPASLSRGLREMLMSSKPDIREQDKDTRRQINSWFEFYHDEFDIHFEPSSLAIPERKEGFDRLLVIAEGLTIQRAYDQCFESFKTWKYADRSLDDAIPTNDRNPKNGTYAIWVRDTVEADQRFKDNSADDLKVEKHVGITALERFIYELMYFKETGRHMDIKNHTLCSGSRGSDGSVPSINYEKKDSAVCVDWYGPGYRNTFLRSREVVS